MEPLSRRRFKLGLAVAAVLAVVLLIEALVLGLPGGGIAILTTPLSLMVPILPALLIAFAASRPVFRYPMVVFSVATALFAVFLVREGFADPSPAEAARLAFIPAIELLLFVGVLIGCLLLNLLFGRRA